MRSRGAAEEEKKNASELRIVERKSAFLLVNVTGDAVIIQIFLLFFLRKGLSSFI